jgi:hypothetical protein
MITEARMTGQILDKLTVYKVTDLVVRSRHNMIYREEKVFQEMVGKDDGSIEEGVFENQR